MNDIAATTTTETAEDPSTRLSHGRMKIWAVIQDIVGTEGCLDLEVLSTLAERDACRAVFEELVDLSTLLDDATYECLKAIEDRFPEDYAWEAGA